MQRHRSVHSHLTRPTQAQILERDRVIRIFKLTLSFLNFCFKKIYSMILESNSWITVSMAIIHVFLHMDRRDQESPTQW